MQYHFSYIYVFTCFLICLESNRSNIITNTIISSTKYIYLVICQISLTKAIQLYFVLMLS